MTVQPKSASSDQSKSGASKFASERERLQRALAALDQKELDEANQARAASPGILAEAFAAQSYDIVGKRDAKRLAKAIAKLGVPAALLRLET